MEPADDFDAAESWAENDLRRLDLDPSEVINNLKSEGWPATPCDIENGIVALINLLRHLNTFLPKHMWEALKGYEESNPILAAAWQKLPMAESHRIYFVKRALVPLQNMHWNSLYELYSRSLMGETFWYRDGLARWHNPERYTRTQGATTEWTNEPELDSVTKNTWFTLEGTRGCGGVLREAFVSLCGLYNINYNDRQANPNKKAFYIFLEPEFLRVQWNCTGSRMARDHARQFADIIVKSVVYPQTPSHELPATKDVNYKLVAVIKVSNGFTTFVDSLRLYNGHGIVVKPSMTEGIPEWSDDTWELGSQKETFEMIFAKVKEDDQSLDDNSGFSPALEDVNESQIAPIKNRSPQQAQAQQAEVQQDTPMVNRDQSTDSGSSRKRLRSSNSASGSVVDSILQEHLGEALRDMEAALSDSQKRGDDAMKQVVEKDNELKEARQQLEAMREQHDEVLNQLASKDKEFNDVCKQIEAMQKERDEARKQVESSDKQIKTLQKKCDDAVKQSDRLIAQNTINLDESPQRPRQRDRGLKQEQDLEQAEEIVELRERMKKMEALYEQLAGDRVKQESKK